MNDIWRVVLHISKILVWMTVSWRAPSSFSSMTSVWPRVDIHSTVDRDQLSINPGVGIIIGELLSCWSLEELLNPTAYDQMLESTPKKLLLAQTAQYIMWMRVQSSCKLLL